MSFWPPGYVRSSDKLKGKYFFKYLLQAHNGVARMWFRDHKKPHVKLKISSSRSSIPPLLAGWWRMTFWPRSLVSSHEKFKAKIWIFRWRLIHAKKFNIGILENKFRRKLISFRQSNLFFQSFLIKSLSLTKIPNMILIQFQAMLQSYTHLKHQKARNQGE